METLLSSGIRVSELSYMNVEDINFEDLIVHVKHGKGAKERTTYINEVTRLYFFGINDIIISGCDYCI